MMQLNYTQRNCIGNNRSTNPQEMTYQLMYIDDIKVLVLLRMKEN